LGVGYPGLPKGLKSAYPESSRYIITKLGGLAVLDLHATPYTIGERANTFKKSLLVCFDSI